MTLLHTTTYLGGRHPLPAGAIPLATDQPGSVICQTPHNRWIRWWPGTRSIESAPMTVQRLILAALCKRTGGTTELAAEMDVSARTVEAWRSCRMPMPIKAAETAARLLAR